MTSTPDRRGDLRSPAVGGLWSLPAYGVLLAVSTLEPQPGVEQDFPLYARFVTTDRFLLSHLGARIGGAALAVLGAPAAVVFLARGRARRVALTGLVRGTP